MINQLLPSRLFYPVCLAALLVLAGGCASTGASPAIEAPVTTLQPPPPMAVEPDFHDAHFHLTNYIQQGISIEDYLAIMGNRVGRSTLFGIPLQQAWSYQNSGDFAPTYYLHSDAPLYYYSFTDATNAEEELRLAPSCYVAILEGRGAGQYRLVESVAGKKLSVSPPWSVIPDKTSRYTLLRAAVGNQVTANRLTDVQLASIMLYGACLGNLVSGNMVTRSHSCGIQCGSLRPNVHRGMSRVLACFHNQIYGNWVSGLGPAGRGEGDVHPSSGIVLRNWYGGADRVRNCGNSVFANCISDFPVGINLRVQHRAVIRGNSISLCGVPIKQGDHLTDCTIEQNTTGMPGR